MNFSRKPSCVAFGIFLASASLLHALPTANELLKLEAQKIIQVVDLEGPEAATFSKAFLASPDWHPEHLYLKGPKIRAMGSSKCVAGGTPGTLSFFLGDVVIGLLFSRVGVVVCLFFFGPLEAREL